MGRDYLPVRRPPADTHDCVSPPALADDAGIPQPDPIRLALVPIPCLPFALGRLACTRLPILDVFAGSGRPQWVSRSPLFSANSRTAELGATVTTKEFRILRLPEVLHLCGISRSSLYEMVARETFPPPVRISARSVGWRAHDIHKWIDSRPPATGPSRPKTST